MDGVQIYLMIMLAIGALQATMFEEEEIKEFLINTIMAVPWVGRIFGWW